MAGPKIELGRMSQLAEAVEREDDWTGVTDAATRRRRQNRLNSRAFRRRKALESARPQQPQFRSQPQSQPCLPPPRLRTNNSSIKGEGEGEGEILVPCWIEAYQSVARLAMSKLPNRFFKGPKRALLPYTSTSTNLDHVIFPLSSDHLISLLQYNVLRGCLVNRRLLTEVFQRRYSGTVPPADNGIVDEGGGDGYGGEEWSSTALVVLPTINDTAHLSRLLPRSLHPTLLQRTVAHAAWIDILPHPVLRDNLIFATTSTPPPSTTSTMTTTTTPSTSTSTSPAAPNPPRDSATSSPGEFDQDALWTDTVGDLFFEPGPSPASTSSPSLSANSGSSFLENPVSLTSHPAEEEVEAAEAVFAGGIVWSPPWDVSGWELSEGFWRKWGWMMQGCAGEALEATNRWRRQRGEEELQLEFDPGSRISFCEGRG